MFQIYHSNKLDMLKDLLVEMIRRDPLSNPFSAETILVQSPGMAQWLKLEMAEELDVAANIDFPLPATFLWNCFSTVLPDVPKRSAFNKDTMTWSLMELLPDQLQRPEFSALNRYLDDDSHQFKLYQLCSKVADIFDQYLVYRPDWMASWERGDNLPEICRNQPWQPILWRLLVEKVAELELSHWHRGNMFSGFVRALEQGAYDKSRLPERLFVFGISALPQNFIESLQALGREIDVHLMVTNPCCYFWGDIVDPKFLARLNQRWLTKPGMTAENYYSYGNPLLASMGKLGRDYLFQLQELAAPEIDLFDSPEGSGLLSSIQRDVLELRDPSAGAVLDTADKQRVAAEDRSLQLHSCHSPLREVEVLYDQLLAMLDSDSSLSPRDIIVMMPDVATYAPYIEAVFGNAPSDRYIPYSISDRTLQQESPLLLSFLKLMVLPQSRVSVSEVLDILEVPAVLRRFELTHDGFDRLRRWIEQSQIRWGLNEEQRSQLGLAGFAQNSWQFGLRRMLAGYAMGETEQLWHGIEPYSEVEGLEAADLGQLGEFIELLEFCVEQLSKAHSAEQWFTLLNEILGRLYQPDEQDEIVLSQIRKVMEQLQQQLQESRYDHAISSPIIQDYLQSQLGSSRSSQRFLVGAVNFCTLMPMRSIPFRIVCLLGMNDRVYPRSIPPMGFDLMVDHPRRGDRSRRDDDRYLFLEALLSAQEKLYISYLGRSVLDNSARVASVLVSELFEYCQHNYAAEQGDLISNITTVHPLQPFNAAYFCQDSDRRLFSYATEWLPVLQAGQNSDSSFLPTPLEAQPLAQLELSELIAFARNPIKHFFQRRLKVFFNDYSIEHQDEEPFELDGLEQYLLKQQLLSNALRGESLSERLVRVQASGLLPVGQAGEMQTRKLLHDCSELAEKITPYLSATPVRQECRLEITGVELIGWLNDIHDKGLLRYRPANAKGPDLVSLWLEHLVMQALGVQKRSTFFGLSGRYWFGTIEQADAGQLLAQWLELYQQGMREPIPLPSDTAWQFVFETQQKDYEHGLEKARQCFNQDGYTRGESSDYYINRVYPEFQALGPRFEVLAKQLYEPLLSNLEQSNEPEAADE